MKKCKDILSILFNEDTTKAIETLSNEKLNITHDEIIAWAIDNMSQLDMKNKITSGECEEKIKEILTFAKVYTIDNWEFTQLGKEIYYVNSTFSYRLKSNLFNDNIYSGTIRLRLRNTDLISYIYHYNTIEIGKIDIWDDITTKLKNIAPMCPIYYVFNDLGKINLYNTITILIPLLKKLKNILYAYDIQSCWEEDDYIIKTYKTFLNNIMDKYSLPVDIVSSRIGQKGRTLTISKYNGKHITANCHLESKKYNVVIDNIPIDIAFGLMETLNLTNIKSIKSIANE